MSGDRPPSLRRVVVLSRETEFVELDSGAAGPNGQVVRVSSAYEAAAEILAAPAVALVIDLRALGRRHLRLFEVAREAGVEMLVAGTVPAGMGTDVFSGARLLGRGDLPAAIQRIMAEGGEAPEARDTAGPGEASEHERPEQVTLAPAKSSSAEAGGRAGEPASKAPAGRQEGGLGQFQQDEALLTAEELSALLGDQP